MDNSTSSRRGFLQQAGGVGTLALAQQVLAQTSAESGAGIPTRVLGRTGQRVSIVGLGGHHIGRIKDEKESIRLMHAAIDEGITFFDNCWDYHDGRSEELMGKALAMDGRRKKVFLMTKVCDRDYEGAKKHLEDSLRRMQTDVIDLWQFHEMVYDNDPDWVFEKGGIKAAIEAQRAGKVRFIGFTGHKDPSIHLKMLSKPHNWDAAQMPIGVMDSQFRSFLKEVVPVCLQKKTGVVGMKGAGGDGGFISKAGLSPAECYRFCLSQPVATQVMGIATMEHLKDAVNIGRDFKPMSEEEKKSVIAKVKAGIGDGRYELYKTSKRFDGPHHRKQHGFDLQTA
ncbi:MAG: aldo/keto reductase [Bryobacteraceae bacterium]